MLRKLRLFLTYMPIYQYQLLRGILIMSALLFAHPIQAQPNVGTYYFVVQKGDSVSRYFQHVGLSQNTLAKILIQARYAKRLNRLQLRRTFAITLDDQGKFSQLIYSINRTKYLQIYRQNNKFIGKIKSKPAFPANWHKYSIVIKKSWYADAKKSKLSRKAIAMVQQALSTQLNFKKLKPGARFIIVQNKKTKQVLAVFYFGKQRQLSAFANQDKGQWNFYDQYGYALNTPFQYPLKNLLVSSHFQKRRWHPVLKKYRPHKGTDFAAPEGTSIYASRSGLVFKKYKSKSFGNVIFLTHNGKYMTIYAHLVEFAKGLKKGDIVKTGQRIGYVGQTGYATGPHLHFEIRVNNIAFDPMTILQEKVRVVANKSIFTKQLTQLSYFAVL